MSFRVRNTEPPDNKVARTPIQPVVQPVLKEAISIPRYTDLKTEKETIVYDQESGKWKLVKEEKQS